MPKIFSSNREYDYIHFGGLCRVTDRFPYEWDLYILKELIDNALDADEVCWRNNPVMHPFISIGYKSIIDSEQRSQQLVLEVSNRTDFPVEKIKDIFSPGYYTSSKTLIKELTRGSLGNALKTLLGIPYALHNRVADDWMPLRVPLSILCRGIEYLPHYVVDPINQTVSLECEERRGEDIPGTLIRIGVDHFQQEKPRTLIEIQSLARLYHLCNPHAQIRWSVEIEMQNPTWEYEYPNDPNWTNKFWGIAPIKWYTLTAFQDLLGALYQEQAENEKICELPVEDVCHMFAGFNSEHSDTAQATSINTIIDVLGRSSLTRADIQCTVIKQLHELLCLHSSSFNSLQLGCIGAEHIRRVLGRVLSIEGDILYDITTDAGDNPNIPFVIEAAIAHLQSGKRDLWTAINFSPTYRDLFYDRLLSAPIESGKSVLGLCGLLEAYHIREDTPVILFLHLICPSLEHHTFSKTAIDHLPFKSNLGDMLDRLLVSLKSSCKAKEQNLQKTIFDILDVLAIKLGRGERFIAEQLVEKLLTQLRQSQDQAILTLLAQHNLMERLRAYVTSYQTQNTDLARCLVHPVTSILTIPLHPDRDFSISTERISPDLLKEHHVNKILYIQDHRLEPVIIENNWLCSMDMALLRTPPGREDLEDAFLDCVYKCDLPILILHNSDEQGYSLIEQMHIWYEMCLKKKEQELEPDRIVDLGLCKLTDPDSAPSLPARLVELMPSELFEWLLRQCKAFNILIKYIPSDQTVRQDIQDHFEALLQQYLQHNILQIFDIKKLFVKIDKELRYTRTMLDKQPDKQIKSELMQKNFRESYSKVLDIAVEKYFEDFMREYNVYVQYMEQKWIKDRIDERDERKTTS